MNDFLETANAGLPEPKSQRRSGRKPHRNPNAFYAHVDSVRYGGWIGELNRAESRVLLWMWAAADRTTGKVEGGRRLIAGGSRQDATSAKRGIRGLVALGLVKRIHAGTSKADRTVWQLLTAPPIAKQNRGQIVTHVAEKKQRATGVKTHPEQGADSDPAVPVRVHSAGVVPLGAPPPRGKCSPDGQRAADRLAADLRQMRTASAVRELAEATP